MAEKEEIVKRKVGRGKGGDWLVGEKEEIVKRKVGRGKGGDC